ncbi:hypothetical protein ACFL3Q_15365 [Planctomycetota bacterium]
MKFTLTVISILLALASFSAPAPFAGRSRKNSKPSSNRMFIRSRAMPLPIYTQW